VDAFVQQGVLSLHEAVAQVAYIHNAKLKYGEESVFAVTQVSQRKVTHSNCKQSGFYYYKALFDARMAIRPRIPHPLSGLRTALPFGRIQLPIVDGYVDVSKSGYKSSVTTCGNCPNTICCGNGTYCLWCMF
jgi:hypothetical protein